jgi:hypothetical protein
MKNTSVEHLLLYHVQPRLRNSIPNYVPMVGSDDIEELIQDGSVLAFRLLLSARRSGRKVSAGNVAFYVTKMLRNGRRSTGERKNDPLNPKARLNGNCKVQSIDEPIAEDEFYDEPLTLGETLAARVDDPATAATRRLDWATLLQALDNTAAEILQCLIVGTDLITLVRKLKRSRSALQMDKERLARMVREHLGADILARVQEPPRWNDSITANREKLACRYERQAA